jgi:hypothetical protein
MAEAPSVEELGPLLPGEAQALDEPVADPYAEEDAAFMAAAKTAVGGEAQAIALKDAMEACLRSHGLIGAAAGEAAALDEEAELTGDVGVGFPDL